MLTSAALPAPNAAMPQAVEGPSASEAREANAADFLAMLGASKVSGKKTSVPKPALNVPNGGKTAALGIETKGEGSTVLSAGAEAAKLAISARTGLKAAGDVKAEGEATKAQAQAALPAAILEALTAGARGKEIAAIAHSLNPAPESAGETPASEPGKIKAKPARTSAHREGDLAAKPDASARPSDAAADVARTAKAESQPNSAPAATKPPEAPASSAIVLTQTSAEPQSQTALLEPQAVEARIQLGARETAQAGFAAPVLAMRVNSKDGITKSIEIRLDPAELGQVDVKLETGHDGKLKAVLSADNADAFELLKKDSGALEAALREAGIDLEEGAITFALNDSGAGSSHDREAAYGGAEARRIAGRDELVAAAVQPQAWRNGVIDISV